MGINHKTQGLLHPSIRRKQQSLSWVYMPFGLYYIVNLFLVVFLRYQLRGFFLRRHGQRENDEADKGSHQTRNNGLA